MPDYNWPDAEHRTLIGKRITRVDSRVKVSGRAKYTYDYHDANMLFGKVLRSPYAKAKIISIDVSCGREAARRQSSGNYSEAWQHRRVGRR